MRSTKQTQANSTSKVDDVGPSLSEMSLSPMQTTALELPILEIHNEAEQYMLDTLHEQSVAMAGRSAVAQIGTTYLNDMARHASYKLTETFELVQSYESAAQVGRFAPQLQIVNNRLLEDTARHVFELNTIAARSMYEDERRSIYKPATPPRRKRKGLVPATIEFLFGEA